MSIVDERIYPGLEDEIKKFMNHQRILLYEDMEKDPQFKCINKCNKKIYFKSMCRSCYYKEYRRRKKNVTD